MAQTAATGSGVVQAALTQVQQRYVRAMQADSRLLTGTEYIDYTKPRTSGHQFLLSTVPQTGTVHYREVLFRRVPLLYDLKLDQVVLADTNATTNVQLLADHVAYFTMGDRRFVRLVPDSAAREVMPTGFYEQLLDGRATLLARRTKKLVDESSLQKVAFRYQQTDLLFVRANGAVVEVSNLKSLLRLLPDKRAELNKFARTSQLKFNKDQREAAAVALVGYYNTLTP